MFCPKCGTQNPDEGKFCRSCGTNLGKVSDAISGRLDSHQSNFGTIEPLQPEDFRRGRNKPPKWESAISNAFIGVAFLIISVILGVTNAANGRHWWFWMLIPGFACLGTGIAQYIQLRKTEQKNLPAQQYQEPRAFADTPVNAELPPTNTEYVAPESRFKTGELSAPPVSVTEHTTRHLEMNTEGETMTLPKK